MKFGKRELRDLANDYGNQQEIYGNSHRLRKSPLGKLLLTLHRSQVVTLAVQSVDNRTFLAARSRCTSFLPSK